MTEYVVEMQITIGLGESEECSFTGSGSAVIEASSPEEAEQKAIRLMQKTYQDLTIRIDEIYDIDELAL